MNAAPEAQSFAVKGQYIKDLSFENPRAPQSLVMMASPPGLEVNVDLKAQKLQEKKQVFNSVIERDGGAVIERITLSDLRDLI